jgi:hypothetical protein
MWPGSSVIFETEPKGFETAELLDVVAA